MKVIFENATIADAIAKASRVAPTKGGAFDKASGILMTLDADSNTVTIRATDLLIWYLEIVDAVEIEGSGEWRFPSTLVQGICSKLPIGSGNQVTFEDAPGGVLLKHKRMKATVRTSNAEYYPNWDAFDPAELEIVHDLGERIQQVEWAAQQDGDPPLRGIHLTGSQIIATDRFRVAVVPCEAEPLTQPITIPAGVFAPVLRAMKDCGIGQTENHLLLMPDQTTQLRTVIYETPYPDVLARVRREHRNNVTFKKDEFIEIVNRALVFSGRDRTPLLTVYVGREEIAVSMTDEDQGMLGDVLEVPGQCTHKRVRILFTPKNLTDAITAAPSTEVRLGYDEENPLLPMYIDGGSGYESWIMPRREVAQG